MKKSLLCIAIALQGCISVNIEATKSLVASSEQHHEPVAVNGHAQVVCKDYFFVERCLLYLDLVKAGDPMPQVPLR